MRSITLSRPTLAKAGASSVINSGRSSSKRITARLLAPISVRQPKGEAMRPLRYLLPLVLIAALVVPVGASAHKVQLTPLVNQIYEDVQARFDSSTEWNNYEFYSKSCWLSRGNRLHRHLGGCVVRFDRSDEDSCYYEVRLRLKSRSNRFHMPPTYEALEPKDRTCPARP